MRCKVQQLAVQGAVQDGVNDNNEIAVTTISEHSIAKWSTAAKSPTLKKLQELCRERKIKVSGRKKELKRRVGLASKHKPEMKANDDTEEQATVLSDTDEVQSPATFIQNQKPPLMVKLPLHSSIPRPVNSEGDYEAEDEEEHLHSKPTTRSQPLIKNHEQENQLLKLQQMIEVMAQKTEFFDKILELLISERIKIARLTDSIKHLQNENDTFKARFSSQENERHTPPAPERSISADVPIPLFVETPMTHRYQESKKEVPDTPQMSEMEEILNDQNDKLRDELAELKAKKMQEDLKRENEKLQQEITGLKKKLKVSKEQSVSTNDKQVTANKKQNIVIISMLNNIEDQYNLNTKKANVSIRAFPASTIQDFKITSHLLLGRNQML